MKIAFLSMRGVQAGGWAGGAEHFFVKALERYGHDVSVVNYPSSASELLPSPYGRLRPKLKRVLPNIVVDHWRAFSTTKSGRSILRGILGKKRNPAWAVNALVAYGDYFSRRVHDLRPDVVVSMDNKVVAYLSTERPVVVWGDAVFDALLGFYPTFSDLCDQTIQEGRHAEARQFEKAALVVYSSQWAMAAAQTYHQVPAQKLAFIPFGANFEQGQGEQDTAIAIDRRPANMCRLVFVCSEWHRKGGEYVLRLYDRLGRTGLPCTLSIVGHYPQKVKRIDGITSIPFIGKASQGDQNAMIGLLGRSHFFLLPTIADCSPMVIPEANSCGVPVLASNVGGIPSLIESGITGLYSDLDRFEEEACRFILDAFQDYKNIYLPMAHAAHAHFRSQLNWDVAAKRFSELLYERLLLEESRNGNGLAEVASKS
jgi:glycosyltransferase involved in cell wall biosynthesis